MNRQRLDGPLEVLFALGLEAANNDVAIPHGVGRDMGNVGGAEGIFGMDDPEIFVDLAQSLSADPPKSRDQQTDDELRRTRPRDSDSRCKPHVTILPVHACRFAGAPASVSELRLSRISEG